MRMWSVHPSHLDRAGLVACWRESLLAQAVPAGRPDHRGARPPHPIPGQVGKGQNRQYHLCRLNR